MLGKSTRIVYLCVAALLALGGCKGGGNLSLGEEARRLNAALARSEPSAKAIEQGSLQGLARPRTLYDSAAVILATGTRKRSQTIRKILSKGALGKLPYETLTHEAQRWSSVSGAAVGGATLRRATLGRATLGRATLTGDSGQQYRRENAWLALDLAQAYSRINENKNAAREIAAEQLLLESVAGFWAQLNAQRFNPAIEATRRSLRNALKQSNPNDKERRDLILLERQLFHNSMQLSARTNAFGRNAGALLQRSKVYRSMQASSLLPPPELLSITYTPELTDRVIAASIPPIRLGAKRSDRLLPRVESLAEALETMPYLGLFAVPPREVRAFNNLAEEHLLLKVSYASAWGLIDLRYRRNTVEAQTYRQSRLLLSAVTRMLSARIALLSYDHALLNFADALWQFQRQERALLRSKPSRADDPRGLVFLQTYSRHLLSAIRASEFYAESLLWSLRLAFANGYLQAPEVHKVKTLDHLSRNADRIEARLRQTPGLLATPLEGDNTRLIFGLPPHRRQALERAIEAHLAIKANARSREGAASPLYSPQPSMLGPSRAPNQRAPLTPSQQLFEESASVYRRLQPSATPQNILPRLQKPSWLENLAEPPQ